MGDEDGSDDSMTPSDVTAAKKPKLTIWDDEDSTNVDQVGPNTGFS